MEPNDATSTSVRAQELRASLGARREVETLLAEASAARQAAAADADAIVEEAQQLSDQLLQESRGEADRVTTEARERAEGIVSRARAEAEDITREARSAADAVRARAEAQVEDYRRRVRAEVTEQVTRELGEQARRELARVHERQDGMIGDLEASVRILGVSLDSAVSNVGEMLAALDELRIHSAETLGEGGIATTRTPTGVAPGDRSDLKDDLFRVTSEEAAAASGAVGAAPRSSMFDNPEPTASVPTTRPVFDVTDQGSARPDEGQEDAGDQDDPSGANATTEAPGQAGGEGDGDETGQPLTATEAYLRSSHIDHGDPPLPPLDQSDVGARYARDAMRATARARTRQDDDALDPPSPRTGDEKADPRDRSDDTGQDDGEHSGKALGWLFRTSSSS